MKFPQTEINRARIEIIPMIDTIFFLLVFFMITSMSLVRFSAPKVDLPTSLTADQKPENELVVSLDKDGTLFLDHQSITDVDLRPLLVQKMAANPRQTLVINCDRSQHMDRFLRIYDLVKQANVGEVMVASTPKPPTQVMK
jgi:biopolymer transport protein ExbD